MATYPNGVYAPRAKANRAGVVYDASKTTVGYVEDVTKLDAEVVAVETELGANPKGTSASVLEKIKGLRSLSDATADTIVVKGGNVGIGTTDPGAKLDVNGNVSIGSVSSNNYQLNMFGSTYSYFSLNNTNAPGATGTRGFQFGLESTLEANLIQRENANLNIWTNGLKRVTIQNDGNVGIGITSPTAKLHLAAGTATANTAPLKFTAGVVNTTPVLGAVEFIDDGTNGHLYITLNVGGVLTRKEIAFVA